MLLLKEKISIDYSKIKLQIIASTWLTTFATETGGCFFFAPSTLSIFFLLRLGFLAGSNEDKNFLRAKKNDIEFMNSRTIKFIVSIEKVGFHVTSPYLYLFLHSLFQEDFHLPNLFVFVSMYARIC